MDIFEELHSEHEKVSDLIASLQSSGRDELTVRRLQDELRSHAEAEERVFYRRLEDEDETREAVAEGYEEHEIIARLLTQIGAAGMGDELFDPSWESCRRTCSTTSRRKRGRCSRRQVRCLPTARQSLSARPSRRRRTSWQAA